MRAGTRLPLRCRKCGRAFKNPGSLATHMQHHREADAMNRRLQDRKETT